MFRSIRKKTKKLYKTTRLRIERLFTKSRQLKFFYGWYYKHTRVKENRILFESFHGKDVSDSPYYILEALVNSGEADKYQIYFAVMDKKKQQDRLLKLWPKIRLVDITSYQYTKILSTAKYLVNNSSFPIYFIRRPEQVYLQTWHGTPLKTLGKNMRLGIESMYNIQHNFLQADYLLFPNAFTKEAMMRDYNLEPLFTGEVVLSGYPRNAVFFDDKGAERIREQLGLTGKTCFAYMPTWRGQSNHDIQSDRQGGEIAEMLERIDESMSDDQLLYVNFHPIMADALPLEGYRHILPFPAEIDKYEFLNAADALITDYSSVMFDYSVTRKPVILFMYDYEEYMYDRGMYLDVSSLPFYKVYSLEDLLAGLASGEYKEAKYWEDEDYISRFIQYDSPDAAQKMLSLVLEGKKEGLVVQDYSENRKKEWQLFYPPNISSNSKFDAIAKCADPDKYILLFEKSKFTSKQSAYLYDNYKDECVFYFSTYTPPRTVLEELRRKNPEVKARVQARDRQRMFPNLIVKDEVKVDYYWGEAGTTFYVRKKKYMLVDIHSDREALKIQYSLSLIRDEDDEEDVQRQELLEKYRFSEVSEVRALLIIYQTKIIARRVLTQEELAAGEVREAFTDPEFTALTKLNTNYQICLEAVDADGDAWPYYLRDREYMEMRSAGLKKGNLISGKYPAIFCGQLLMSGEKIEKAVSVAPYINRSQRALSMFVSQPEVSLNKFLRGKIEKIRTKGSVLMVDILLSQTDYDVQGVELVLRNSVKSVSRSLSFTSEDLENGVRIHVRDDLNRYKWEPMYWDLCVVVSGEGSEEAERIYTYTNEKQRKLFKIGNYQCDLDGGNILFPYGERLAFSYRERTPYDGWNGRIREIAAVILHGAFKRFWKKKRIWLVYEKFCTAAQENGYYFFKYCMENLPEEEKKHIYYILDKKSADWEKMQVYGKQVLPYMSFRYMIYILAARLYISPDSRKHLYIWRARPNLIEGRLIHRPLLFLQHGVTALKRVHNIFGSKAPSRVTYFVTTSTYEQNIIVKYFGYPRSKAPILGFCRWDALVDKSDPREKQILVMPTWRMWLEESPSEEFVKSEYYNCYKSFLTDERLNRLLHEQKIRLIFYIHPKLRDHLADFDIDSHFIDLIPFGEIPLNEIIMKSQMLITDFSSVCWDAYYLEKPVLFFQFDRDKYTLAHGGSYLDLENELFGDAYFTVDELVDGIIEYVGNGFREKEQYAEMRDTYFTYRDDQNCQRTYEYIISRKY
ncbi:MAG: CDP-glycerol glycerophosphotransferase family protein [Blautia sp.]|nr:CDP-glycerol glycerophosphotransferase family protein [Blautia sp.]